MKLGIGVGILAPDRTGYAVELAPGETLDPAAVEGLDALHAFYERNATALRIERRNAERLEAARERYEAAHPTPPRNKVLNFWMIKPEGGR